MVYLKRGAACLCEYSRTTRMASLCLKKLYISTGETMTHARNFNTSANGGYPLNPTKEVRFSMSLPAKARATVKQVLMCFMCLTSLIVHASGQQSTNTTI